MVIGLLLTAVAWVAGVGFERNEPAENAKLPPASGLGAVLPEIAPEERIGEIAAEV